MRTELFRIPLQWLQSPVGGGFTAGTLLLCGLATLFAAIWFWQRRQGRAAAAWGYLPGLLLVAAAGICLPRMFAAGLPIRGYGVMVLVGSLAGIWLAVRRARQRNLNPDVILSLTCGMFVCGILGARLFYVIEYWDTRFQQDTWTDTLLAMLKFTEGGLVVYGAFLGACAAFFYFVRQRQLPPLALADLIAPSLLVGLACGRLGCLLNGCCYGGESNDPWAVTFPANSMVYVEQIVTGRMFGFELAPGSSATGHSKDGHSELPLGEHVRAPVGRLSLHKQQSFLPVVTRVAPVAAQAGLTVGSQVLRINGADPPRISDALLEAYHRHLPLIVETAGGDTLEISAAEIRPRSLPVHPTQIYSAINAGLLAWVLWNFYPYRRREGEVTAVLLTLYPLTRFLLEMIRVDEAAVFGTGLSISQNISLVLCVIGLGLWVYLRRLPPARADFS